MRSLILHHHIFKNAGSTIDSIFLKNFGSKGAVFYDKEVKPGDKHFLSEAEVFSVISRKKNIVSFSSHQTHCQKFSFDGFRIIDLAMVRHPIVRIRSIYKFYRNSPRLKTPFAQAAQNNTFEDFVGQMVEGVFVQHANDPQSRAFGTGNVGRYIKPDKYTLEAAKERMEKISCVGVVEEFDLSLAYAENVISKEIDNSNIDFSYKVVNQTGDVKESVQSKLQNIKDELGDKVYTAISERNQLDVELWIFAQELLKRRAQNEFGIKDRLSRISNESIR